MAQRWAFSSDETVHLYLIAVAVSPVTATAVDNSTRPLPEAGAREPRWNNPSSTAGLQTDCDTYTGCIIARSDRSEITGGELANEVTVREKGCRPY